MSEFSIAVLDTIPPAIWGRITRDATIILSNSRDAVAVHIDDKTIRFGNSFGSNAFKLRRDVSTWRFIGNDNMILPAAAIAAIAHKYARPRVQVTGMDQYDWDYVLTGIPARSLGRRIDMPVALAPMAAGIITPGRFVAYR